MSRPKWDSSSSSFITSTNDTESNNNSYTYDPTQWNIFGENEDSSTESPFTLSSESGSSMDILNRLSGSKASTTAVLNPQNTGILSNALGSYDTAGNQYTGWASPALGLASGIFDSWLAFESLDLAKDTAADNKELAWANYDAQKNTTNAQLQWLEDSRNANMGAGSSDLSEYMIS